MTSGQRLLNDFLSGPAGRSNNEYFIIACLLLILHLRNARFVREIQVRRPNQIQGRLQILVTADNERHVSCFRRPTVRACFAFRKDPLLVGFRQSNVAVTAAMDMHKHCPSDEKRVFVDSRILPLRHTRQVENPLS